MLAWWPNGKALLSGNGTWQRLRVVSTAFIQSIYSFSNKLPASPVRVGFTFCYLYQVLFVFFADVEVFARGILRDIFWGEFRIRRRVGWLTEFRS